MKPLLVQPVEGRRVRDPETGLPLPPEPVEVLRSAYWSRRLRDGDVVESKPTPKRAARPDKKES